MTRPTESYGRREVRPKSARSVFIACEGFKSEIVVNLERAMSASEGLPSELDVLRDSVGTNIPDLIRMLRRSERSQP